MKFGELISRLRWVELILTGEIKITSGIKISSMVLKLPCELVIWSLDSKSSRRDLLGTRIPTFSGICQWNKIRPRHGLSPSLMHALLCCSKQFYLASGTFLHNMAFKHTYHNSAMLFWPWSLLHLWIHGGKNHICPSTMPSYYDAPMSAVCGWSQL